MNLSLDTDEYSDDVGVTTRRSLLKLACNKSVGTNYEVAYKAVQTVEAWPKPYPKPNHKIIEKKVPIPCPNCDG